MRFNGKIKIWEEERGFGFIEPTQGGQDIFVHITSFSPRSARPLAGQLVTFGVELGPQGKKRAKDVEYVRPTRAVGMRSERSAEWTLAAMLAIPIFVALFITVAVVWSVRGQVALAYVFMSLISFMAYALDKSAALVGRWRTSEQTLHLIDLACGWPGGLLAQQLLRHKSSKGSFREIFWLTVAVNAAGFALLHTPVIADWLR